MIYFYKLSNSEYVGPNSKAHFNQWLCPLPFDHQEQRHWAKFLSSVSEEQTSPVPHGLHYSSQIHHFLKFLQSPLQTLFVKKKPNPGFQRHLWCHGEICVRKWSADNCTKPFPSTRPPTSSYPLHVSASPICFISWNAWIMSSLEHVQFSLPL